MQKIYADRVQVGKSVDEDIQINGDPQYADSNNPKMDEAARTASSELENTFKFYLAGGTVPIPDASTPDWFTQLANRYTELLFWKITNGTDHGIKEFQEVTILRYLEQFELPFRSSTNG